MHNDEQITFFAETDARNKKVPFGIKAKDRTKHVYVIGKTGMGKSTLLENMAVQDIRNGNGFAFLDPHGQTAELLLDYIPEERMKDVLYFAPFDMEHPISFNVMEDVGYDKRHLVVSGLMSTFKKIWQDVWSARMEYILANTLLALLEYPGSTLLSVNKMLSDKKYRKKVVDNIGDSAVKSFWIDEFANYTERMAAESTPAIQNKIGQFTSNPIIRNIIGQPKSSFDFREMMDDKKIIIVNLSKGRIGELNANLLGSMLITKIYLAAMSRADIGRQEIAKLPNFYLYVDEFQSFANEAFADILSEARKYKLNLTIAHQYIEQMSDEVRAAVFGNVGTMITFRVGATDAEALEKEFSPTFLLDDIVNLGAFQIYLRLMIDGIGSHPFSATTLPPLELPEKSMMDSIIDSSRNLYGKPRAEVEEQIREAVEMGRVEPNQNTNQKNPPKKASNFSNSNNKNDYKKDSPPRSSGPRDDNNRSNDVKPALNKDLADELKKQIIEQKKKIIEESESVPLEKESLSLQSLVKKDFNKNSQKHKKDDGKGPTPESKSELKNALSVALGNSINKPDSNSSNNKQEESHSPKISKEVSQDKKSSEKSQISEDELRKVLSIPKREDS